MPRPCKRRRICNMPRVSLFGPKREGLPCGREDGRTLECGADSGCQGRPIRMELDEYECIRLLDLEGMTQEECAAQMGIARTTVQAIYSSARRKLALCLAEGADLVIEGGNYVFCEGGLPGCRRAAGHCCHRKDGSRQEGARLSGSCFAQKEGASSGAAGKREGFPKQ